MSVPEWTTVARTGELTEGEMTGATVAGEEVVVVNVGGDYRALGATCTHAGCLLSADGDVEGDTLTCGCHGSIFDVASGEAVGPPAEEPLPVYDVRVDGDAVQVAAPAG